MVVQSENRLDLSTERRLHERRRDDCQDDGEQEGQSQGRRLGRPNGAILHQSRRQKPAAVAKARTGEGQADLARDEREAATRCAIEQARNALIRRTANRTQDGLARSASGAHQFLRRLPADETTRRESISTIPGTLAPAINSTIRRSNLSVGIL